MVIHRNGKGYLCSVLTDDVFVHDLLYFKGLFKAESLGRLAELFKMIGRRNISERLIIHEHFVAVNNALVADVCVAC